MVVRPVEGDARAKCTQVIIMEGWRIERNECAYHCNCGLSGNSIESIYLHPASLSLRAYILPMSPIPMIPMIKLSILPSRLYLNEVVIVRDTRPADPEDGIVWISVLKAQSRYQWSQFYAIWNGERNLRHWWCCCCGCEKEKLSLRERNFMQFFEPPSRVRDKKPTFLDWY